ncbi:MAG: hypothetical protein ACOCXP_01330 [Candidatus Dojkabacteria bacterium]
MIPESISRQIPPYIEKLRSTNYRDFFEKVLLRLSSAMIGEGSSDDKNQLEGTKTSTKIKGGTPSAEVLDTSSKELSEYSLRRAFARLGDCFPNKKGKPRHDVIDEWYVRTADRLLNSHHQPEESDLSKAQEPLYPKYPFDLNTAPLKEVLKQISREDFHEILKISLDEDVRADEPAKEALLSAAKKIGLLVKEEHEQDSHGVFSEAGGYAGHGQQVQAA